MDTGHRAEVWPSTLFGSTEATVCSTATPRTCQYLVGNFVAIQPDNHQITWNEFKAAFREHYIPEGVLHMKQEEFMKQKQGGDTVNQYLNKFNHLSQYAIDQVNTDLKKEELFYERTERPDAAKNGCMY